VKKGRYSKRNGRKEQRGEINGEKSDVREIGCIGG
jgi:hypothetical protein